MIQFKKWLSGLVLAFASLTSNASTLCPNQFPNFISDICWSCMFPIKLAGVPLNFLGNSNSDFKSGPGTLLCGCLNTLSIGIPLSFWEQAYLVDVHTEPGCMPALGGFRIKMPWNESQYGKIDTDKPHNGDGFRHSTYYVSPLMYLLEMVLDDGCTDRSPFDVGWQSEFDPTWDDDELALIKMPISYMFGSIPAVLAGGIDAVASQAGFPINEIFWQAGSLGSIYPLTGNTKAYKSNDQLAQLIAVRMLAEAHAMRELAGLFSKGGNRSYGCEPGEEGCSSGQEKAIMCAQSPVDMPPVLIMKKRQYKLQRTAPVPGTAKVDLGQCCHPIGRNPIATEAGTKVPLNGFKDFTFSVFRKRDCCAGVYSAGK